VARVVLAEDDETMVSLLGALLRLDGFEVEVVQPDEDVPSAVERLSPDMLVLDVVLSRESGLEVLDRIRRMERGRGLYTVMISGLNVREECLLHGADDFLLKPFMPEELTGKLRQHLPSPK
jgi:DNA-binding response OmpR family regulator